MKLPALNTALVFRSSLFTGECSPAQSDGAGQMHSG
jgi:hypothetical protein